MKDGDIIVIDKIEDADYQGKPYKRIRGMDGLAYNIKSGQNDKLKNKWPLLQEGSAIILSVGQYQGKDFVQDFRVLDTSEWEWCNEPDENPKQPGPTPGQAADMQAAVDKADGKTQPSTPVASQERQGTVVNPEQGKTVVPLKPKEGEKVYTDPEKIKTIGDFFTAVKKDFNLLPDFALKEINKTDRTQITDPKAEYLIVAATFKR